MRKEKSVHSLSQSRRRKNKQSTVNFSGQIKVCFHTSFYPKCSTALLLCALLFLNSIVFTSCGPIELKPEPQNTEQTDVEPDYNYETIELGGENSGLTILKWCKEGEFKNYPEYEDKNITDALKKQKAYLNVQIKKLDELTKDDAATKNYLGLYTDKIKSLDFTTGKFDSTVESVYNDGYQIYADLITALPTREERMKFNTICSILFNESLGRGGSKYLDVGYNEKMNGYIKYLKYCGMTNTDTLLNDVQNNNCAELFNEFKLVLTTAINNLNQKNGMRLTVEEVITMINVTGSAKSMQSLHDILPTHKQHELSMDLDYSMHYLAENSRSASRSAESTMER